MSPIRYISILLAVALLCVAPPLSAETDPYEGYDEAAFMDMDFDQNLMLPKMEKGESAAVKKYMTRKAQELSRKKYAVDLMRNDEVMVVSLPTDGLFLPNDTILMSKPLTSIKKDLLDLTDDPDMYKLVYAIHTDNTGSPVYNQRLSHQRSTSIYDWILDNVSEELIVIPFEMAETKPVEPNNTRAGRAKNRRLELYFIPGPKMIEKARAGSLK